VVHREDESDLTKIMENCDRLDAEEKAKLIKHLLGEPGLQVVIGSNQVHATTVYQLNLNSPEQISTVLEAIAKKITSNDSETNNGEADSNETKP
jgi:predicted metal-dependent TIM-barrel fold hydrolase